jgi:excisionase family DNA binding protein
MKKSVNHKKQSVEVESPWLTVSEAAARLKLSPRTLQNYIQQKKIGYYESETGTKRLTVENIDSFLRPVEPV